MKIYLSAFCLFLTLFCTYAEDNFNLCRYAYVGDAKKIIPYLDRKILNDPCENGGTPLLSAVFNGHYDVAKLLIAHGADVNALSRSGRNILVYAAQQNRADKVMDFLSLGVDIPRYDEADLWYYSLQAGHDDIFMLLTDKLKDPNQSYIIMPHDVNERTVTTLLVAAASENCMKSAEKLMQMGADINRPNSKGETPLIAAMRNYNYDMAEKLISLGASPGGEDVAGNTVLSYAIADGQDDIALKAIAAGADIGQLLSPDILRNVHTVLEYQIFPSNNREYSYLHLAAAYGRIAVAKELIGRGADIGALSTGYFKLDAAAVAAFKGEARMLRFLISAGAHPYEAYYNTKPTGDLGSLYATGGGGKYTLLSLAAISGDKDIAMIDYLLSLPESWKYGREETVSFYLNMLLFAGMDGDNGFYKSLLKKMDSISFDEKSNAILKYDNMMQAYHQYKDGETAPTIDTQVWDAVGNGDIAAVKKYVADGYDIKTKFPGAVREAANNEKYGMALYLLSLGYPLSDKEQPLVICPGDWNDAKKTYIMELLKKGADINARYKNRTLLSESLESNDLEFINKIAKMGAEFSCSSHTLANVSKYGKMMFFDNKGIEKQRLKLLRCADVTEAIISLITTYRDGEATYGDDAASLMQASFDNRIKVDYGKVTDWLNKYGDKSGYEEVTTAVRYFSGKPSH